MKFPLQDEELIALAKEGDQEAKELFFRNYIRLEKHLICVALPDFRDYWSEDAVLEEFLFSLLKSYTQFSDEGNSRFQSFFCLCLRRDLLKVIRHITEDNKAVVSFNECVRDFDGNATYDANIPSGDKSPSQYLNEKEIIHSIEEIASGLKDDERAILRYLIEGYSTTEIAEKLRISEKRVRYVKEKFQRISTQLNRLGVLS